MKYNYNKQSNYKLPGTWTSCVIEDVVISQKGKRPRKVSTDVFENCVPYLDIKAIETGVIDNYADSQSSVLITENDLIIVWDGSRSGWVGKGRNGALGSTLMLLTPVLINYDYLYYFLKRQFDFINSNIKGSGIPHVNQDIFWKIEIPLPPLGEQELIAKKIDEAYKKLSSVQIALDKIPDIVSAAKEKILKRAFSGELTTSWRTNFKTSDFVIEDYIKDDMGWYNVKADDCCVKVSNGSTPKGKRFEIDKGIPFLKVYNIVNQKINFEYKSQFIDEATHHKQKKSIAYPKDILINIVGPPLGKVAIIPDTYPEWNMNQALVLFRPKDYLLPDYLYFFFLEGTQIKKIENEYRGSAGQSNISLTQCRNFEIKIPSIEEQKEIIGIIESQLEELDKIINKNVELRYSMSRSLDKILEEAFNGELVEHFDIDDPQLLLEDIHNQKILLQHQLLKQRKIRAKEKNVSMAQKKNISLIDILKKEFGTKEFTFLDIEKHSELDYENLKDEIYTMIDNKLSLVFNENSNTMVFKIKNS